MRSQRLTVATNFLPYQEVKFCAFTFHLVGNAPLVGAKTAKLRPARQRVTSARLSCSSSPKKVTLRLCCSLINALATRRLATNFFRYRAVRLISFLQNAVAANTFRYQAGKFPLEGNAHRAFRGGKRVNMPFGRSTGKHKIDGTNTQCNYFNPCNARPSNARFVTVFTFTVAVGAGAPTLQFYRIGFRLQGNTCECREVCRPMNATALKFYKSDSAGVPIPDKRSFTDSIAKRIYPTGGML